MPGPESEPIVSKVEDAPSTVEQAPQEQEVAPEVAGQATLSEAEALEQEGRNLEDQPRIAPENPDLVEKPDDDYGVKMWKAEQRAKEVDEFHQKRLAALADNAGRAAHAHSGSKEPYVPQPPVEIDTSVGIKPNWTDQDQRIADAGHKAQLARISAAGHSKDGKGYEDLYPKAS